MTDKFRIFGMAAIATLAGAVSASAATIDFTASTNLSGTEGGGWTVTTWNSPAVFDAPDANCAADSAGALACTNDGIGIGNDEISQTVNGLVQYATITFDNNVKILGFSVLDTYKSAVDGDFEVANMTKGAAPGAVDASADAVQINTGPTRLSGYAVSLPLDIKGTTFTFWSSTGNDNSGQPDIALASIEIGKVPVPASGLLLLGALGGLSLARRKKKA